MHLNEFADPKTYGLPADDVAPVLRQLERIWRDHQPEDDTPVVLCSGRQKLMDERRRGWTMRQSRRRRLSTQRSQ